MQTGKIYKGNLLISGGGSNGKDGKSAYELWLAAGNIGTVEDYLASLKGDTGVSADYPITIYNGLDSAETDEALAAVQGKLLDGKIAQLGQEATEKIGGSISPSLSLEQGSIASATGLDTTVLRTERIRTANYIRADKIKVTTAGNKVSVVGYKEDGTFVSGVGWLTTSQDVTISGAVKYRFIFAYSDDATIVPTDFPSLGVSIVAEYKSDFATTEELSSVLYGDTKYETTFGTGTSVEIKKLGFTLKAGETYRFTIYPYTGYTNGPVAVSTSATGSAALDRPIVDVVITEESYSTDFQITADARYLRVFCRSQQVRLVVSKIDSGIVVPGLIDMMNALSIGSIEKAVANGGCYGGDTYPLEANIQPGKRYIAKIAGAVANSTSLSLSLSSDGTIESRVLFRNYVPEASTYEFPFETTTDYPYIRFYASTDCDISIVEDIEDSQRIEQIEDTINRISSPVDIFSLQKTICVGWLKTDSTWSLNENSRYIVYDVSNNPGYIEIEASSLQDTLLFFLSEYSTPQSDGETPSFCAGYGYRVSIPANNKRIIKIPSDCSYIALAYKYTRYTGYLPRVCRILPGEYFADYEYVEGLVKRGSEPRTSVIVAASNSDNSQLADYVCDGINDEVQIQSALDSIQGTGNVILLPGDYYIDNLAQNSGSPYYRPCALAIKEFGRGMLELRIAGTGYGGGAYSNADLENFRGAVIHITDAGCNSASAASALFGAAKSWVNIDGCCVRYEHMKFVIERYDKPVTVFDNTPIGGVIMEDLSIFVKNFNDIVIPNRELIGIRGQEGYNYGVYNYYKDVKVGGFYTGFQVGGEHLVMINVQTRSNIFGYTFNDFAITHGHSVRPITMINCSSEQDAALPRFNNLGGKRKITMIDFNIEAYLSESKTGALIPAQEKAPGSTTGFISWSIEGSPSWVGDFWQSGHGLNIETRRTDKPKDRTAQHQGTSFFDGNKPIFCKSSGEKANVLIVVGGPNLQTGTIVVKVGSVSKTLSIGRVCTSASDFAKELWLTAIESGVPCAYDDNVTVRLYNSVTGIVSQSNVYISDNTNATLTTTIESLGSSPVWVDAMGNVV